MLRRKKVDFVLFFLHHVLLAAFFNISLPIRKMKEKKKKLRDKCGMIGQGQQPPQKIKTNKIMTIKNTKTTRL